MGLCCPLQCIFEQSVATGCLPDLWKQAIVFQLLKKSPAFSVDNYRPISLVSSFCKILELLVKKALVEHLNKFNLLNESQFGFLKNRSTSLQLTLTLNDWIESINKICKPTLSTWTLRKRLTQSLILN